MGLNMTHEMRALIFSLALLPTIALAFKNEPTGFRGIEWGAPIEKFKDELVPGQTPAPGIAFYQRKADKMAIGEAELSRITYIFYKGLFQQAMIRTAEGIQHHRALREAFVAQFGPGDQPNRYIERWFWSGSQAMILLNCSRGAYCTASLMSRQLYEQEQRDKKAAAEGAKKDF
jgi:hypothetical protein